MSICSEKRAKRKATTHVKEKRMKRFIVLFLSLLAATTMARPFRVVSNDNAAAGMIPRGGGRRNRRIPTQIVVAAFSDSAKADTAAELLRDAAAAGIIYFRNLAVIRKYVNGSVVIHEYGDMKVGYAATVGMFVGGMSLLLLGPAGVLAGGAAGALLGGAAQAMLDDLENFEGQSSLDKHRLEEVGEILTRGSSALVCVFEDVKVNKGRTKDVKLKEKTQDAVLLNLEEKMRRALYAGKDVAFAITVDRERISAVRMVYKKKAMDIKAMMVTKKNRSVGRAIATGEGVSYQVAETTPTGSTYKTGTVKYDQDL